MTVIDRRFDYGQVVYDSCFLAGRVRPCYGRITLHHVISKHSIKARVKPIAGHQVRALRDRRNILGCCIDCHLGLLETGNPSAQVRPEDLPEGFWDFVAEYDLWGRLPRHLKACGADKSGAAPQDNRSAA